MRLGFSIAAHLDPDVLLLDEVFAVGDESFQRKCIGKILDLKERGRTLLFVSHSAPAVERLCERAILLNGGEVVADGPARDAIAQYHRMLAAEESPAERGAGLREWGTGEARVVGVSLEDGEGEERRQFLSGQALVVRLGIEATEAIPPPRITIEFRDANGSLLGVNEAEADELGWDGSPGAVELLFSSSRLPLADGRFQLSVALSRPDSTRQFHRLDPALEFTVFPDADQRGWFRFEGEWSLVSSPSTLEPR
jgi:hypothetical protein